jgi:RNA polymerase sigma factor (sigma-70 family)
MAALRDGAPAMEVAAGSEALRKDLESRFIRFVAERRERARRLAWRLVGGHDAAADDVVQDAFLKAYKGLAEFRGEASIDTWFYRIVVRQAERHRRWRAVRELWSGGSADVRANGLETAAAQSRDPALQRRIGVALERLSQPQKQAFVLVHLEGFSVEEAAEIMGKANGTVKSHLHRALVGLRRELADLASPAWRGLR